MNSCSALNAIIESICFFYKKARERVHFLILSNIDSCPNHRLGRDGDIVELSIFKMSARLGWVTIHL